MSAEQATRLPELARHHHEHQREEGHDSSFQAFIVEHYASDSKHHETPNHTHHLPGFDGGAVGFVFAPNCFTCLTLAVTELTAASFFGVPIFCAGRFFSSLLQPPR